jgi:hypothetical protein
MPLEHDKLAMVLIQALSLSVGVSSMKIGCLAADLGGTRRKGGHEEDGQGGDKCVGIDGGQQALTGHRLILSIVKG